MDNSVFTHISSGAPCLSSPCVNGDCLDDGEGGYECDCYLGYTGDNCDECKFKQYKLIYKFLKF